MSEADTLRGSTLKAGLAGGARVPGRTEPPSRPAGGLLEAALTKDACLPLAEWQVAEAEALVHTLDNWSVAETMVVPTKTPDRKLIFGKGTLEHLTGGSSAPVLVLSLICWRGTEQVDAVTLQD